MNNRIEKVDFLSLVKLLKKRTGLAVDIWADDSGCLREEFFGCAVVLFPKGKGYPADPKNLVPMSVSEGAEIWTDSINEIDLSPEELLQIKLFVRENRVKLLRLSDPIDEYDADAFLGEMKTSGFFAEVNRTVLMTSRGKEEIIGPNSDGKLVLPQDWYDTEDDMHDVKYGEYVELVDMFDQLQTYSHELLMNSPCASKARAVLSENRIPEDIWVKFGLGYLPALKEWINSLGFGYDQKERLKATRILRETKEGEASWFSERIVFPIRDIAGHCTKIWGRIVNERDGSPVYVGSAGLVGPDEIFGLFEGLEEITSKRVMILCEGPMDVLAFHSAGIGNACSLLQCPISNLQKGLIRVFCDKVIIMYDCDNYGQEQATKILGTLRDAGIDGILLKPEGACDPLTMYLNEGTASFKEFFNAI